MLYRYFKEIIIYVEFYENFDQLWKILKTIRET